MPQLAVVAHVLVSDDVLARRIRVVHRRQAHRDEELRHVPHPGPRAVALLGIGERFTAADLLEHPAGVLGDAAGQLTSGVAEKPAVRRVGGFARQRRQRERLAVVPGRMSAAVIDDDGVVARRVVEVLLREGPIDLRIVEHEPADPEAGRRRRRLLPDRRLDFGDRSKVAVHAVQLVDPARMRVRIDESRRDGHLAGIEHRRPPGRQVPDIAGGADGDEPAVLHRKRVRPGLRRIHRQHVGVHDNEIRFVGSRSGLSRQRRFERQPWEGERASEGGSKAEKLSARVFRHRAPRR